MPTLADIEFRLARPDERDVVLAFVADMGFNPRDAATWDGLGMLAMTAWRGRGRGRGPQLLGAIPMEPRILQVQPGRTLSTLHQTVVAVHPQCRSEGIGSRLQQAIAASPPCDAVLTSVFREDPDSPACRWYVRNGFSPAIHIEAWFLDEPADTGAACDLYSPDDPALDAEALEQLWRCAWADRFGGFVHRAHRPLRPWLAIHPYRSRYRFHLITLGASRIPRAYALLGVGQLHSATDRADILEFCASKSDRDELLNAIVTASARMNWRPIRWALAAGDEHRSLLQRNHFEPRWHFDMLIKPLGPVPTLPLDLWRFLGVDYI